MYLKKMDMRHTKYIGFLIAIMVCLSQWATAQQGYIQNDIVKITGVTSEGAVIALPQSQKITSRAYTDGLGRTIQNVSIQASPLQKDMVQPIIYDNLGMVTQAWLPYTDTSTNGSYQAAPTVGLAYFYANTLKVTNDAYLYSQQVFEKSPLQRLLRAGAVGDGYQPVNGSHYTSVNYRTNTAADSVIIWSTAGVNSGYYAAGKLQVMDGTDAEGSRTLSFKNNDGQMVLKRQLSAGSTYTNTYYVYNEAGAVRNMIPPKAVTLMKASGNWDLTQTAISNLIFSYQYDNQGHLVEKTVPGGISVYTVYDPLNRPVLIQDNKLRATNKWNYIKYDVKDHPISQGIYTDNTRTTRTAMQTYVSGLNYSTTYFEKRSSSSGTGYYTNSVFPTSNIEPLAYSYYDNYDLDNNGTANYSYQSQGLSGEGTATAMLRGIPTMMRSRTVGKGLGDIWLIKVMFYDKDGRVIQTQGNNQLNSAAADIQTSVPDFTGITQQAKVTQVAASTTTTVLTTFSYDLMYRLLAIDQAYNAGSTIRVAGYEYNELGQLVKKNIKQLNTGTIPYNVTLGTGDSVPSGVTSIKEAQNQIIINPDFVAASGSTFTAQIKTNYLQAVDYRYTINGQLKNINNSKLIDDNGVTNNDANDLFGMDLLYEQTDANLGNTGRYDGNISAVKWMTLDANNVKTNERSYKYSYNLLNRITASSYAERGSTSTGSFNVNVNGFNEDNITYDVNGNILTLRRNSSTIGASSNIQVDNLTYTYDTTNPNRLKSVTDGTGANYTSYGFRNLTGSSGDYGYDSSGNLTADPYKGLTLSYNILNKTDSIIITTATNRYIRYTYNSAGQMIRKQAFDNAVLQKTTDYIDGFVYENSTLTYFAIPEGRVVNASGTLTPEFVITDQQGNARINFRDNGSGQATVTQENSYYAFGLVLANSPIGLPAIPNKNLYNGGSEWQNDFSNLPDYYQTFFRNYDQALGRFVAVDPLAEAAESLTGYNYSGNNPVMFNDPMGDAERKQPLEIPLELPQLGGSGSGGGPLGNGRRNFVLDGAARQWAATQLRAAAWSGDPAAVAEYVSLTGGVTVTDPNKIANTILALDAGRLTLSNGNLYGYDQITPTVEGTKYPGPKNYYKIAGSKPGGESVGQPGELESMIFVWGPGRAAVDHFQNGNYWRGLGYTALAVSDLFLVESVAKGIGRGAWKLGSHSWSATRKWMVNKGYAEAGEPLHHWAITQATAKKYGLEAVSNQPWNLVKFSDQSMHIRAGHGLNYLGQPSYGMLGQFLYGTPIWFKAGIISGSGRIKN
jgi:RHS repeat-associated protein